MTDFDGAELATSAGQFTTLSPDECKELLEISVIGRIAFHSAAGLELLPINFLYLDGFIYTRVDKSSVIGELAAGVDEVAFQTDFHEDLYRQGWSVSVKGSVEAVTNELELANLGPRRQLKPWAIGDRNLFLRLTPRTFSGRKVIRYAL